jgi:hypothetical protein
VNFNGALFAFLTQATFLPISYRSSLYQVSTLLECGRNSWGGIKYQAYMNVAARTLGDTTKYQAYLNVAARTPGDTIKYQAYMNVAARTPVDTIKYPAYLNVTGTWGRYQASSLPECDRNLGTLSSIKLT